MKEVALVVGGRRHLLACPAEQEAHVRALAADIDRRLAGLPRHATNDARNLLLVALTLADELGDLQARVERGPTSAPKPRSACADKAEEDAPGAALHRLADRLESCAALLEELAASP
ncbi:cell division protein ZapA [Qipengyuania thermophila]|uniref:cell division protein ZapA n=1 Tax=Qipengyuania thermophila TaxID=2509361 RepID=UPI0013EB50A3|nr:cell division protein ZapA [Qipengyuania thermophila]